MTRRSDAIGRRDGVGRDVAGAAEVFDQRLADDRLDEQGGQRRERSSFRLAWQDCEARSRRASARASSSVSSDRRGSAGRSGKSRRQCAPTACLAPQRGDDDHQRDRGRISRRRRERASATSGPTRVAQTLALAHDAGGARQDRPHGGGIAVAGGMVAGRTLRRRRWRARLATPSIDRATTRRTRPPRSASCSRAGWRRAGRCRRLRRRPRDPRCELRPSASTATPPI